MNKQATLAATYHFYRLLETELKSLYPNRAKQLTIPMLTIEPMGKSAGSANGYLNHIWLNEELMNNKYQEEMVTVTLPHEIAHLIVYTLSPSAPAHGKLWKAVMQLLGADNSRCHSMKVTPLRKVPRDNMYSCGCKTHAVTNRTHNKMQQGETRICRECKRLLELVDLNSVEW